jgi:hypothetical protein
MVSKSTVPEFIDPVLAKTSPKRSFSMTENEHFGLVFAKTGSIHSGTVLTGRSRMANGTWQTNGRYIKRIKDNAA